MAEIEVFQRHIADVIGVRDLNGVFIFLFVAFAGVRVCDRPRACPGFCPVSGFNDDLFGEDVLLLKKHFERSLNLGERPFAFMKGRENGDQHIGVMLDVIQIEVILVIIVGGLVVVQLRLQLCLHPAILFLSPQHGIILAEIGGRNHRLTGRGKHRGA